MIKWKVDGDPQTKVTARSPRHRMICPNKSDNRSNGGSLSQKAMHWKIILTGHLVAANLALAGVSLRKWVQSETEP